MVRMVAVLVDDEVFVHEGTNWSTDDLGHLDVLGDDGLVATYRRWTGVRFVTDEEAYE